MRRAAALALVAFAPLGAACGKAAPPVLEGASALLERVAVDTAPGLSGLCADEDGALWTVAERAEKAYRITLSSSIGAGTVAVLPAPAAPAAPAASAAPAAPIEAFAIEGVPPSTDLEGIAALGGGRFALGTEGRASGVATVLLAERRGQALAVTGSIALPSERVGVKVGGNAGAEGVCGAGGTIVAAIETAGDEAGRRWAPLVRIADGAIARVYRLWLTSPTGKLSALDCRVAPDGSIAGWAIERHFEVTKLLRFVLPPPGQGADDIAPTVALDLSAVLAGKLNLEGIAALPDGRVATVVDNQWKRITGPSELVVIRAAALAPAK